jgi:hypothetical protein
VDSLVRSASRQAAHYEDEDGTGERRDTPTRDMRQYQGNLPWSVQDQTLDW